MSENNSVSVILEHVTKRFKDTKGKADVIAVSDSNLTIKPGELVTLLGPSGCGKTTTLRMIAGFELPTEGKVFIGGEEVTLLPPNKRNTATMFQSYGLFPHMSVFNNVAYGLKLRKVPTEAIADQVNQTLEMVGLGGYGDRAPSKLSGGQQQRVALARSLIVTPGVLLLDEPLSNLDALLREQMRIEIRKIQKRLGITAIYVTHDRIEAMSLSDRIIVMKAGVIRQIGTPSEVYEYPNSRFVAGFVGKAAFIPVKIMEKQQESYRCRFNDKDLQITNFAPDLQPGSDAVLMARPESLRVVEPGKGKIEGKVRLDVYLGSSMECYVDTNLGEILVQVDDPHEKRIFDEGADVSIDFSMDRVRLLDTSTN